VIDKGMTSGEILQRLGTVLALVQSAVSAADDAAFFRTVQ
jgi:hypothetical protein